VLLKKGDDLRKDCAAQTMFRIFNSIWENSGLDPKPFYVQYGVMQYSVESKYGLVEKVTNSSQFSDYDWRKLKQASREEIRIFLASLAGGFTASWVMGLRDRHQDNMMIKDDHIFFHIDLGRIFNDKTTVDAPRFAIPKRIRANLSTEDWEFFKTLCVKAFRVLRRQAGLIEYLCCLLFKEIVDEPTIHKCMHDAFMLKHTEQTSCDRFALLPELGMYSRFKDIKDIIHSVGKKRT